MNKSGSHITDTGIYIRVHLYLYIDTRGNYIYYEVFLPFLCDLGKILACLSHLRQVSPPAVK